jgi:hypothetical protein
MNKGTGTWGMDFVSSSPLFSTIPPFFKFSYTVSVEKIWTQNTRIIHDHSDLQTEILSFKMAAVSLWKLLTG